MTAPLPDYTPEEKAAILAKYKKEFTVEMLIEYIEDDDEKFPAEQVLEEMVEAAGAVDARKRTDGK
jgi:hypothetical protein